MMNDSHDASLKTYGGWRRARGYGLFGLGAGSTALVVLCLVIPLILFNFSAKLSLLSIIPAILVVAIIVTRVDGVPIGDLIVKKFQWWWGSMRGYPSLRAGVVVDHAGAWQLPGVLAPTRLVSVEDPGAERFGIVWDQRTGLLTTTVKCSAASTGLVDKKEAEAWVNNWHEWLAGLGYIPSISHATVTVETAPEPGSTLADNVYARIDPHAPEDARKLMQELVWRSPAAAADVDTRVSVSFNPRKTGVVLKTIEEQTAEISRTMVGLEAALSRCGVAVLGRATDYELAGIIRAAFDPTSRGEINRLVANPHLDSSELLRWGEAGPVAAEESWDMYQHDSGYSVSWAWHEAPRQEVPSEVLSRLLAPGGFPKRVTLMYRPLSAGDASRTLESQVNAAVFRQYWRAAQKRDETARDKADRARAQQAAQEEAEGAGLVLLSMYVTVTVSHLEDLPQAVADVEARADQSKIKLRKLFGSQALGFATTLPAGVCPPLLSSLLPGGGKK